MAPQSLKSMLGDVMQTFILMVCTIAVPSHALQAEQEPRLAQPEGLLSGLGRLVERAAMDFGAHAAHLLLNGLPPEHLAVSSPAGGEPCSESFLKNPVQIIDLKQPGLFGRLSAERPCNDNMAAYEIVLSQTSWHR